MTWLDELPALRGDRALDVATGAGRFAAMLAGRYREVVAIDRPAVIAGAPALPGVTFRAMDAEHLEFPDQSFDLAALSWSLHALANPTGVLHEMRRVLRPGGVLLLVEPIAVPQGNNQDLALDAHALLGRAATRGGHPVTPLYQRLQVTSLIQGLGLTDVAYHPLLTLNAEAAWDTDACRTHAAPLIEKLEAAAPTLEEAERRAADALVSRLRQEGARTAPMMLTYGRVPEVLR